MMISRLNATPAFGNSSKWAMAGRKAALNGATTHQAMRNAAKTAGKDTAQRAETLGQSQIAHQQAKAAVTH